MAKFPVSIVSAPRLTSHPEEVAPVKPDCCAAAQSKLTAYSCPATKPVIVCWIGSSWNSPSAPMNAPPLGLSVSPFAEPVPGPQSLMMPSEPSAPVVSAVVPLRPAPAL